MAAQRPSLTDRQPHVGRFPLPERAGELTVAVSCSNGAAYVAASAWTDLAHAAGPPGAMTEQTHAALGGTTGTAWTCRFRVALSSTANVTDQGITVSEPITWTLT